MKVICIGRNYIDHAKELNNEVPQEPVIFLKPDTALLRNNEPFFVPDFANEFHYETELVIKINRLGKNIAPQFANRYYEVQHMWTHYMIRCQYNHHLITIGWEPFYSPNYSNYLQITSPPKAWNNWINKLDPIQSSELNQPKTRDENILNAIEKMLFKT